MAKANNITLQDVNNGQQIQYLAAPQLFAQQLPKGSPKLTTSLYISPNILMVKHYEIEKTIIGRNIQATSMIGRDHSLFQRHTAPLAYL